MEQKALSPGPLLRNAQTFGRLQHAPQLMHCPVRFSETGSIEVTVLLVFASHVFLFPFPIIPSSSP
jgi:hypothetical protein